MVVFTPPGGEDNQFKTIFMKTQEVVFLIPKNQCPLLNYPEFIQQKRIILNITGNDKFSFDEFKDGYKVVMNNPLLIPRDDTTKIIEFMYKLVHSKSIEIFETIFPLHDEKSWNVRLHNLEISRFGLRARYEFFESVNQTTDDPFKVWRGAKYDLLHISFK